MMDASIVGDLTPKDPVFKAKEDHNSRSPEQHLPNHNISGKKYSQISAHHVNRKFRAVANVVNASKQRLKTWKNSSRAEGSSSSSTTLTPRSSSTTLSSRLQQLDPKQQLQRFRQPTEMKRKRNLNQQLRSELAAIVEENYDLLQQVRMEKMDFSYQRTERERELALLQAKLMDPKSSSSSTATARSPYHPTAMVDPIGTVKPSTRSVTAPTPSTSSSDHLPFEDSPEDPIVFSDESNTEPSAEAATSKSVAAVDSAPSLEDATTAIANASHDDDDKEELEQQQQQPETEPPTAVASNDSIASERSAPAIEDSTAVTNENHVDDEEAPEQDPLPESESNLWTMEKAFTEVTSSSSMAAKKDAPSTTTTANDDDDSEVESEQPKQRSEHSLTDPRLQILTYFNKVSSEEVAITPSIADADDPSTLSESAPQASVFTVWRPTSDEAIRKMVEGEGVGKGLEIKGKSSKAGVLSGFVPYLQIHKEEHKALIKTMDRGGRTRIFFTTEQARDAVLEDLGPLQNHLMNAVQDAKRTVRHSVMQVLYVPHHAKKKVEKAGKAAKKTAKKTGKVAMKTAEMASSTVSHATSTVSTSVVTAGSAVGTGAMRGLSHAGGSVSKISHRASVSVLSAGGAVANFASPVSNTVANITNPVGNTVASITSPVRGGVKKGVGAAFGTVTSSMFIAAKGVSKVGASGSEFVTSSVTKAGKVAKKTAKKTGKVAKKTVTTATSTVSTNVAAPVASGVVNVGSTFVKGASMISAQASSTAKTAASTATRRLSAVGMGAPKGDGEQDDEVEWAMKRLLWDMDDPSIRKIDDYSPRCYGIELPDRLLWQAFVADRDISRPEDSRWFTGRPSQPAFQDMNLIAISKSRKNQKKKKKRRKKSQDPLVVLWQTCTGDSEDDHIMDPRGLVMAYEECGRVLPVVSDFDCFTMGSRQIRYDVLPEDQVKLLDWCVSNIEDVLENQKSSKDATWTDRWLGVLKSAAMKGFHPEIPKYGFGDPKSYGIVENAVDALQGSGAVRHGAECFNFYFPQDLDDEFLIVSESLTDCDPKWRYVGVEELQDFLFERVKEGFTFPLNPKWVLCDDPRWKELYDCLLTSNAPYVQESLQAWIPNNVREKIEEIRGRHPEGFVSDKARDDEVCGTEAMDLAMLDLDRLMILRRARNKLWIMGFFLTLLRTVRARRAELEPNDDEDGDEEEGSEEELEEEELDEESFDGDDDEEGSEEEPEEVASSIRSDERPDGTSIP